MVDKTLVSPRCVPRENASCSHGNHKARCYAIIGPAFLTVRLHCQVCHCLQMRNYSGATEDATDFQVRFSSCVVPFFDLFDQADVYREDATQDNSVRQVVFNTMKYQLMKNCLCDWMGEACTPVTTCFELFTC